MPFELPSSKTAQREGPEGDGHSRRRLTPTLLSAVLAIFIAALLLAPIAFGRPNPFDEGFVATGAMLIRRGALPIRDFFVIYGPGQYYFTAATFSIFSEDLAYTRAAHLVWMALLGATLVSIVTVFVRRPWPMAAFVFFAFVLMAWIVQPIVGYAALPATLALLLGCIVFAKWTVTGSPFGLMTASILMGAAGVFRWDFGVFGVVSLIVATLVLQRARTATSRELTNNLVRATAPALSTILCAFAPFIILGGAVRWFDEVPRFHLLEFKTWRNLEFVGPAAKDAVLAVATGNLWTFSRAITALTFATLPLTLAATAIVIAARRFRRSSSADDVRRDGLAFILALVSILLFNQMRVRAHWQQGFPAYLAALPLAAYALSAFRTGEGWRCIFATIIRSAAFVLLLLFPAYVVQGDIRSNPVSRQLGEELPRASGTQVFTRDADRWIQYVELIRHVQDVTRDTEPIYSGVLDTSRLVANDAMLYFLANRIPATRWVEMEPGLTNTMAAQYELIDAMERARVNTAILLQAISNEPNSTSQSNGVHLLDEYFRLNFFPTRSFGPYVVMTRRAQ